MTPSLAPRRPQVDPDLARNIPRAVSQDKLVLRNLWQSRRLSGQLGPPGLPVAPGFLGSPGLEGPPTIRRACSGGCGPSCRRRPTTIWCAAGGGSTPTKGPTRAVVSWARGSEPLHLAPGLPEASEPGRALGCRTPAPYDAAGLETSEGFFGPLLASRRSPRIRQRRQHSGLGRQAKP